MSDIMPFGDRGDVPQLVLTFQNTRPIPIADLGFLFSSLAADYTRVSRGRSLVVFRLETGSLIARLADAATLLQPYVEPTLEVAKAVSALGDFADLLGKTFKARKDAPEGSELFSGKRRVGIKSAEGLVKIVADVGGELNVQLKEAPGVREWSFDMTSRQAIEIRERGETERAAIAASSEALKLKAQPLAIGQSSAAQALSPALIADGLVEAAGADGGASEAIKAKVEALANALRDIGAIGLMAAVASHLEALGQYSIAAVIREVGSRSDNPRLPGLT